MARITTVRYIGNRIIPAIKAYRTITGCFLKEAKDAIENPAGIILPEYLANTLVELYYSNCCKENAHFANCKSCRESYPAPSPFFFTDFIEAVACKPANPLGLTPES